MRFSLIPPGECHLVVITMPMGFQDAANRPIRLGAILEDIHDVNSDTRLRAQNALLFGAGVLVAWLNALGIEIDSIWGSKGTRCILVNVTLDTRDALKYRRGFYMWKDILKNCPRTFSSNETYLLDYQYRSFEEAKEQG